MIRLAKGEWSVADLCRCVGTRSRRFDSSYWDPTIITNTPPSSIEIIINLKHVQQIIDLFKLLEPGADFFSFFGGKCRFNEWRATFLSRGRVTRPPLRNGQSDDGDDDDNDGQSNDGDGNNNDQSSDDDEDTVTIMISHKKGAFQS